MTLLLRGFLCTVEVTGIEQINKVESDRASLSYIYSKPDRTKIRWTKLIKIYLVTNIQSTEFLPIQY